MTSEVCMMNRLAAVLAADSASTVSYPATSGKEERYFKGANKIFQLSNHQPVGLMIYDSADVLNVPWEILVKEFRRELGSKSFNALDGYAQELFAYMNQSARFFPEAIKRRTFLVAARAAGYRHVINNSNAQLGTEERKAAIEESVKTRIAELEQMPFGPCITQEAAAETSANMRDELVKMLADWQTDDEHTFPSDLSKLADLSILEVIKKPDAHLSTTGLVFAGYGDHDIFPAMVEYKSCGMAVGCHIASLETSHAITHEVPAYLSAFAQTEMSDTFSLGLSLSVFRSLGRALATHLRPLAEEIVAKAGANISKSDLDKLLEDRAGAIRTAILEDARREHATPMRRVLGVLPVNEMAELAETLINLQSLKEKVTRPSETVSGPIDVAVITRSEGLVWIKRKHFFDPALNSRYMQRQASHVQ